MHDLPRNAATLFCWRWLDRARHPLARLLLGTIGAVLLVGLLALGFFAILAFAVVGTILALVRASTKQTRRTAAPPPSDETALEGEYVVVLRHSTTRIER